MSFQLPELPYSNDALAPHISPETISFHWGKHHKTYVDNLNKLVPGTEFEKMTLEEIIKKASGPLFNNAAQVWNHTFYWNCMGPKKGGEPKGKLAELINRDFGGFTQFKEKFTDTAIKTFGSGWAWLIQNSSGKLELVSTSNAANPMTSGGTPLMTCDVWEHAYYIDYRNDRAKYLSSFWNLVNWDYISKQLK